MINKYKHYISFMIALVLANYLLVPLIDEYNMQLEENQLLSVRYHKSMQLLDKQETLTSELKHYESLQKELSSIVYAGETEDKFKLKAQSILEKKLSENNCQLDRIEFKGKRAITESYGRWEVELKFVGDILCVSSTTRSIESLRPMVRIETFNFSHRLFNKSLEGKFNASLQLSFWQSEEVL